MPTTHPTWSRLGGVLVSILLATSPLSPTLAYAAASVDKSETVHVQVNPSGDVSEVTVENLLANDAKQEQLTDKTALSDIKPADDKQSFAQEGDGTIVWKTNGKQVSYKGGSTLEPPVEVAVTYTLDGSRIAPEKLAGKSGHLVMRIDYKNTSSSQRSVNGETRTIYTPFMCMTALMLDSEVFSNVQVENGKVIDDKGGMAVIGYALPGLKESLDIDSEDVDLDLPEHIQITADVTDFALDPVYTIITPELFGDLDSSDLDFGLDDMDEGSDSLRDAMGLLISGSSALGDALHQLTSGTRQIGGGVAEFKEKIGALPTGIAALSTGLTNLSDGLGAAKEASGQLADGAAGLTDLAAGAQGGVATAIGSVSTAHDSIATLKEKVDALDLTSAKEAMGAAATAADNAHNAAEGVFALSEEFQGNASQYQDAHGKIDEAIATLAVLADDETLTDEQRAALEAAQASMSAAGESLDGIALPDEDKLAEYKQTLNDSSETLAAKAAEIDETAKGLDPIVEGSQAALDRLDEASEALGATDQGLEALKGAAGTVSGGISALSENLGTAATGAATIATQLGTVSSQAPQMLEGLDALNAGIDQLATGLEATAEGSDQLTSGLSTFDDEAISKIIEAFEELDDEMGGISDQIDSLRDAANDYDTFDAKADGQTSSVRFIYKTEQIG